MKRLLAVILVVTVFAISCGQASLKTNVTTALGLMLSSIPAELTSKNVLWFSNYEIVKKLAGLEPDTDAHQFLDFIRAKTDGAESHRLMDLMTSCYTSSMFTGEQYMLRWKDAFGYDAFSLNQEIWVGSLPEGNKGPLARFSVMKGNIAKDNIIEKLNNIGYQHKNYASFDYYSLSTDNKAYLNSDAGMMAIFILNRMMVTDREIIAARADDVFFSVLDTRSGKQSSLKDSLAYTRIAESLGDVLGAALIPQSIINLRSASEYVEYGYNLDKSVKKDWGNLHAYDLAGIGFRLKGQEPRIVIALHYPDKSAASDAVELKQRITGCLIGGTLPLSDRFNVDDPEATVYGKDSILKIELTYRVDIRVMYWQRLVDKHLDLFVTNPKE